MISTLGHFVLFLALGLSLYAVAAAVFGARTRREDWLASSRNAVLAQFCLVTLAIFLLEYALITSDFSLRYVANNSTRGSLTRYKIAGLWGSLEGSILLWAWLQSLFSALVVARYDDRHQAVMPYVQAVLQGISAFFLLVMTFAVNPFAPLAPVPPDGRGLNPLLEVTDMLVHPLLLYLGYVGFSVPFAFAMAALITGRLVGGVAEEHAPLDGGRLAVPHGRDLLRRLVVVSDPGVGRVLGLGPGGERLVHALADGDGLHPLGDDPGAEADAEGLEPGCSSR